MKTILTILALLFISAFSFAQNPFPSKELTDQVYKRKLVVQLFTVNNSLDSLLNEDLKEIIKSSWQISEVEFMTPEQINRVNNNPKYALLIHGDTLKNVRVSHTRTVPGGGYYYRDTYVAFTFSFYNFTLTLKAGDEDKTVTDIGFANGDLSRSDFIYLCQQLNNLLTASRNNVPKSTFYDVPSNIEKCKTYTLVLLEDLFKPEDRENMSKLYTGKYKFVKGAEYEKIIADRQPQMGYVKIIWSNQHRLYLWIVVDAENGRVISQMGFGGVSFGSEQHANEIIKGKHLKYCQDKFSQNLNNRYRL